MSTALDNKILPKVLEVINRVGVNVTLKTATKTYNPTTRVTTESNVSNVVVKASPPTPATKEMMPGETYVVGDQVIYIAGKGATATPVLGMEVTSKSQVFQIVALNPLYSGDDIAAWECFIRR